MDDLTNDEISDIAIQEKQQKNLTNVIDELLNLINRSYCMFQQLSGKQIGKMIAELLVLIVVLGLAKIPFNWLAHSLSSIFAQSSWAHPIVNAIYFVFDIAHLLLSLIIFFYIYNMRYLSEFEKKFRVLVREMFSYMDVGENTAENFYHAFVLGMLVGLKDSYYVNSNRESGFGRYDIMLEPQNKNGNSFIIEFKVADSFEDETIEEVIASAKKQIEEKGYESNLRERGFKNITKMVFAFKGKECKMEVVK